MNFFLFISDFSHLKASTATIDDGCFNRIEGKVLIGVIDELIQEISESQCLKACRNAKTMSDIICKAAIYYPKEQVNLC